MELLGVLSQRMDMMKNKNKWSSYCTAHHSAALGGHLAFFQNVNRPLKPEDVLDRDVKGQRVLHYLAMSPAPSLSVLRECCEAINAIDTKLKIEVKIDDEDDGDDDKEDAEEESESDNHNNQQSPTLRHSLNATVATTSDSSLQSVTTTATTTRPQHSHHPNNPQTHRHLNVSSFLSPTATGPLPVLKHGWLQKSGTFLGFARWRKRWVSLTDDTLEVFKGK